MISDSKTTLENHPVVSREQWIQARTLFLQKEKEFTHLRDELSRQRREMLRHRDISFVTVSRSPLRNLEACRQRMGWRFKWVSSLGSDFNFAFNASFAADNIANGTAEWNYTKKRPGATEVTDMSVFYKDAADLASPP